VVGLAAGSEEGWAEGWGVVNSVGAPAGGWAEGLVAHWEVSDVAEVGWVAARVEG
jgi:hypothetical protein